METQDPHNETVAQNPNDETETQDLHNKTKSQKNATDSTQHPDSQAQLFQFSTQPRAVASSRPKAVDQHEGQGMTPRAGSAKNAQPQGGVHNRSEPGTVMAGGVNGSEKRASLRDRGSLRQPERYKDGATLPGKGTK
jgi:hypothetical protein